jgi:hypothetical protein
MKKYTELFGIFFRIDAIDGGWTSVVRRAPTNSNRLSVRVVNRGRPCFLEATHERVHADGTS